MSFSVNVRLGEVSASTSLTELSASVKIQGEALNNIAFSANKDTELDFADTITFSVDNPSSDVEYIWRLEDGQGFDLKEGTQVKQDYTEEGQFDVKVLGHYLDQGRLEGINYQKDFVKVDFKFKDPLLNQVPGAAAAYSIRLLRDDYRDGLLRVRAVNGNGADQGEADVKPDGNITPDGSVTISLNSPIENLDSKAQGRGLSNSDTLGDLVDSGGANYDGFVPKWYDQSPNARHAKNSTASEQPQLVDAGSLITENGKPTLEFFGNQKLDIFKQIIPSVKNFYANIITNKDASSLPVSYTTDPGRLYLPFKDFIRVGSKNTRGFVNYGVIQQVYANCDNFQMESYLNGALEDTITHTTDRANSENAIGSFATNFDTGLIGTISETFIYPSPLSDSNLDLTKNNQNNFFLIY